MKNQFKNFLLKIFVALCQLLFFKKTYIDKKKPRILIVSTTGLGDTLWATPVIKDIKKSFPSCYLAVLTSKIGFSILQNNPDIDSLKLFQKPFIPLLKILRKEKFQAVLHLHSSKRVVLPFCTLLGAEKIIGHAKKNKGLDSLLTVAIQRKDLHEIERRKELATHLGAKDHQKKLLFYFNEEEKNASFSFLDHHKTIIGIHPGAKDFFKRWPISSFATLCTYLQKRKDCQFIITGSKEEKPIAMNLADQIPGSICTAGLFSLREMGALLSKMDVFISNDTGPMHLACAINIKCVAIFAPTDPNICGPYHMEEALVLSEGKTCDPCIGRSCQDPFCMLQLSPKNVYDAMIKKWGKNGSENSDRYCQLEWEI